MPVLKKADLLKLIQNLKPAISKKDTVAQTSCILFTGQCGVTYNDVSCIHIPFETPFTLSVKAEDLQKSLSIMEGEELEVKATDMFLEITTKGSESKFAIPQEQTIVPYIKVVQEQVNKAEDNDWKPVPKDFIRAATLCSFSASKDQSMGRMSCIKIDGKNITSTDGYRGSWYEMESNLADKSFLIRADASIGLEDMELNEVLLTDSWIHFSTSSGAIFSTKIIEGDFYDVLKIFKETSNGVPIEILAEMSPAVKFAEVFSEETTEQSKTIKVSVSKGKMVFSSSSERGSNKKEVPIKYDGESFEFFVNPKFFLQVLERSTTMQLFDNSLVFANENFHHRLLLKK